MNRIVRLLCAGLCFSAAVGCSSSDSVPSDEPLGEAATAVVSLAARLGIDLTAEQRECIRDRAVSPNTIDDPNYGLTRCIPSVIATSFGDRLAAADPSLEPRQIACAAAALESTIAAAEDEELEVLVASDQLADSMRVPVADALAECELSDDLISSTVGG